MINSLLEKPSPIWENERLSKELGVDLKVKRDDLIQFLGGGNKVRKMIPIVEDASRQGADAVVTAGGPNSNHLRVFALVSAYLNWHCSAVVHSEESPRLDTNANLQIVKISGATVKHCTLSEAPDQMDSEMDRLREDGYNPYYVWGGGHTPEGVKAYVDAIVELNDQMNRWTPDYIVVASGTGGTHAGLHIGASKYLDGTEVVGISIARQKERGIKKLKETKKMYSKKYDKRDGKKMIFLDRYNGGGYEEKCKKACDVVDRCAEEYGLILDPVYTGKAFAGLIDLIKRGRIEEGARILFWHTGGLLNLFPTSRLQ